jgi:hypothetical protein
MAKLEFYRQQTTPRVIAPDVGGLGRIQSGLAQTGEAIARGAVAAGQLIERRNLEIEKRKEDEAAIDASARAVAIKSKWMTRSQELEREAAERGEFEGFTDLARTAYDEIVSEELKQTKSESANAWLRQRADEYSLNVFDGASRWEAQRKVERDVNLVGQSLDQARQIVGSKPQDYAATRDDLALQYARLPPEKRAEAWAAARQRLAYDAGFGAMRQNPRQIDQALKAEPGKSGIPYIDELGADERLQLRAQTDSELRRLEAEAKARQAERREVLRERISDQSALLSAGYGVSSPISRTEFVAAGMGDQYADYQESLRIGTVASSMVGMDSKQITELLAKEKPAPTETGFAERNKRYQLLLNSAKTIVSERTADPIQFAANRNLMKITQLDPADPVAFAAELKNRSTVSRTMTQEYGTPMALMTNDEAKAFSAFASGMTSVEKVSLFTNIRRSLPDDAYQAIMGQIRADSPVTSMAGSMLGRESQIITKEGGWFSRPSTLPAFSVAERILQGEDLLNPTTGEKEAMGRGKFPMPSDGDLRAQWVGLTGDAYRASPEVEATAYQAYRAFYAAEAARRGNYTGEFDSEVSDMAARAVSGGVTEIGGYNILLPWGMDEDSTINDLNKQWPAARKTAGLPDSVELDDVALVTVGNGVYMATDGTAPLKDKNGRVVYLRVNP